MFPVGLPGVGDPGVGLLGLVGLGLVGLGLGVLGGFGGFGGLGGEVGGLTGVLGVVGLPGNVGEPWFLSMMVLKPPPPPPAPAPPPGTQDCTLDPWTPEAALRYASPYSLSFRPSQPDMIQGKDRPQYIKAQLPAGMPVYSSVLTASNTGPGILLNAKSPVQS